MWTLDIETLSLPLEQLKKVLPPFNPDDVKCGNLKDPEKIKAKIKEAGDNYWTDAVESAALDARTGQVAIVGFFDGMKQVVYRVDQLETEKKLLETAWLFIEEHWREEFVGVNSARFDLLFLIRRSWLNRVVVPPILDNRKYLLPWFIDLLEAWKLNDRDNVSGGLDGLLRAFGLGQKDGSGAEFGKLWAEDREKAVAYHVKDLHDTYNLAKLILPLPISRQSSVAVEDRVEINANLEKAGL